MTHQTHQLVRDVIVELPGRDTVRDFLANDAGVLELYESSGVDSAVNNQSGATTYGIFWLLWWHYYLYVETYHPRRVPYVQLPDPHLGTKVVLSARRQSDARTLNLQNAWFSAEGTFPTNYFFNLFDVDGDRGISSCR